MPDRKLAIMLAGEVFKIGDWANGNSDPRPGISSTPRYAASVIRAFATACAMLVGGCLSIPPPPASGEDASVADGAVADGLTTNCGAPSQFTARAWPPAGPQIGIRDVLSVDVNGDGQMDLVLSNVEVADDADWGIFVMLGPQSDFANLQYHAFIPTNVNPWAIAARDLGGDGCAELTAFGANRANDAGLIDIYELNTKTHLWEPALQKPVDGFTPVGDQVPVQIAFGDFDGDGTALDVAVADLTRLRVLNVGADLFTNLPSASPVDIGPTGAAGAWADINALFVRASANSARTTDDLIVVEQFAMTWLQNDGSGGFGNPFTQSSSGVFISRTASEVDLDGVPPLDIVGGSGDTFGVYLLAQSGDTIQTQTRPWNSTVPVYNMLNEVLVGDLGGTAAPEVVVLEVDENLIEPAFAFMVDGVSDTGSQLTPTSGTSFDFSNPAIHPTTGTVADFNGDGTDELWVFAQTGEARCLRRNPAGPTLQACP